MYDSPGLGVDTGRPRTAAQLRSSLSQVGFSTLNVPLSSPDEQPSRADLVYDEWLELNQPSQNQRNYRTGDDLGASYLSRTNTPQVAPNMSPVVCAAGTRRQAVRSLRAALEVASVMECLPPAPSVQVKIRRSSSLLTRRPPGGLLHQTSTTRFSPVAFSHLSAAPQLAVFGTADLR